LVCALALTGALWACGERETAQPAEEAAPAEPIGEPAAPAEEARPAGIPKAPPPRFPRGLVAREAGVSEGYVLFNPLLSDTSYLVNNDGEVVHAWKTSTSPGAGMDFLPNGNLLRTGRDPEQLGFRAGGTGGILQELDWDGNVVWEWRLSEAERVLHHDIEPLPNGNVLAIAWEVKSPAEARRAGRRADQTPEQGLWPDWVVEIEPVRPRGGKIVWEWHVWDHLVQDHDPEAEDFGDPAAEPGRLDVNADADAPEISPEELAQLQALGYVPDDAKPEDLRSDFLHTNAVSYHPRLDQIALSVRPLSEIWIIDHGTTTAEAAGSTGGRAGRGGDLLYRWGNPTVYGRGGRPDGNGVQRLFYPHDVRWIPDGWEGAGNLTVFNNGLERPEGPWSSVDEWTPPVDANGRYALDGGPFGPVALAWQYRAPEPTRFYAPFISGAQRLANGNTLVCSGTGGESFEVTRGGEIVWEYRNPFSGDVRNADGSLPQPGLDENPYAVFRATRIPADHPALAGRELVALEPQPPWFDSRTEARSPAPDSK
jgi:hypothetical protein